MKKILASMLTLAVALVLGLGTTGCSKKPDADKTKIVVPVDKSKEVVVPVDVNKKTTDVPPPPPPVVTPPATDTKPK